MLRTFPNYCLNYVSWESGNVSCRRKNAFHEVGVGDGVGGAVVMSVLCTAVVVCLQEQLGYSEVRDWEEIQMRQRSFHFA